MHCFLYGSFTLSIFFREFYINLFNSFLKLVTLHCRHNAKRGWHFSLAVPMQDCKFTENMAACQTYINTLALYCIKCGTWLALHWLFWKKIMFIIFKIMLRLNIKSMVVFFPIKRHLNFCNILQKPDIPHILYFTLVSEMQWLDQPFFGWVSEVWW